MTAIGRCQILRAVCACTLILVPLVAAGCGKETPKGENGGTYYEGPMRNEKSKPGE